jgi:hypothetical protein
MKPQRIDSQLEIQNFLGSATSQGIKGGALSARNIPHFVNLAGNKKNAMKAVTLGSQP